MDHRFLATYLNDHLAGSQTALELLRHLEEEQAGTPIAAFAAALKGEVKSDRGELEALMAHLGIAQSVPRKAAGWLGEKLTELKLRLDGMGGGELRLLEILETLSLGIEGKQSLWRALEAASDVNMALRQADYPLLRRRAEEQRAGVETLRLEAARKAFGSSPVAEKG